MDVAGSSPAWWRIVAAFALTPLIAAFAFAIAQPLYAGLPSLLERIWRTTLFYAVFGGYPATLLFGVPAFLVLRKKVSPSAPNCATTGALVASLPWLLLGLISNPDYAYSNGHVTHQNGAKTWWGWLDFFTFVSEIAALGALAGVIFWTIAAVKVRRSDRMSAYDDVDGSPPLPQDDLRMSRKESHDGDCYDDRFGYRQERVPGSRC